MGEVSFFHKHGITKDDTQPNVQNKRKTMKKLLVFFAQKPKWPNKGKVAKSRDQQRKKQFYLERKLYIYTYIHMYMGSKEN